MRVNHELVWATLAHIEADLAGWDQRVWAEQRPDGTVHCFGGRAVVIAGYRVAWELDLPFGRLALTDGRLIEQAAAEVLGIAAWDGQSRHVFHPSNSLDDLRFGVAELCGAVVA